MRFRQFGVFLLIAHSVTHVTCPINHTHSQAGPVPVVVHLGRGCKLVRREAVEARLCFATVMRFRYASLAVPPSSDLSSHRMRRRPGA